MKRILIYIFSTTLIFAANDTGKISFSKHIFPIIEKKCLPCHSKDEENPSEYFMDDYNKTLKGGKKGIAIVPGKSHKSNFILKLTPNPPFGKQMPMMTKKKLNDSTISIFKKWIDDGALNN